MALLDSFSKEDLEKIVKESYSLKEVLSKLGYSTKSGNNSKTLKNKLEELNIDISHFKFINPIKRTKDNIFIEDSSASQKTLRKWYKKGNYTEYVCSICNQKPFWNGKELTLILDHINGKNNDDRLANLRWVCPNCNQQLDTTGFRKANYKNNKQNNFCIDCNKPISKNSKRCSKCNNIQKRTNPPISKEDLEALIKVNSFKGIGNTYKVTDNTVRKWCQKYDLPFRKKDIV